MKKSYSMMRNGVISRPCDTRVASIDAKVGEPPPVRAFRFSKMMERDCT